MRTARINAESFIESAATELTSRLIRNLRVSAVVVDEGCQVQVASCYGVEHRRVPLVVAGVHLRTGLDEHSGHLFVICDATMKML